VVGHGFASSTGFHAMTPVPEHFQHGRMVCVDPYSWPVPSQLRQNTGSISFPQTAQSRQKPTTVSFGVHWWALTA
jgi:hypothetical protein